MKKFMKKYRTILIFSLFLVMAVSSVSFTLALETGKSGSVVNTFQAAEHDTSIDENGNGTQKNVRIQNKSNSPAFVRVRITVSPSDAATVHILLNNNWKPDGDFYYYLAPVQPNGYTQPLMDSVTVKDGFVGDDFDVTVYEESCVARVDENQPVTLAEVKAAFAESTGSSSN